MVRQSADNIDAVVPAAIENMVLPAGASPKVGGGGGGAVSSGVDDYKILNYR